MLVTDSRPDYDPVVVDRLLRNWEALLSRAEGGVPARLDAGRPARGKRGDRLAAADRVADVEAAIASCFREGSLELRTVRSMQDVGTLRKVCGRVHMRWENVLRAYRTACEQLALHLGWEPPPPDDPLPE